MLLIADSICSLFTFALLMLPSLSMAIWVAFLNFLASLASNSPKSLFSNGESPATSLITSLTKRVRLPF